MPKLPLGLWLNINGFNIFVSIFRFMFHFLPFDAILLLGQQNPHCHAALSLLVGSYVRSCVNQKFVADKSTIVENRDGTIIYTMGGFQGRFGNEPTQLGPHGARFWCRWGKLHRENDLPAVIDPYGRQTWYFKGVWNLAKYPAQTTLPARNIWYFQGMFLCIE